MASHLANLTAVLSSVKHLMVTAIAGLALAGTAPGEDTIVTIAGGGLSSDPLHVGIGNPAGVAIAPDGTAYWSTGSSVMHRRGDGTLEVVAGNGGPGFSGDGGPATSATLFSAFGLAFDAHGNLFFSDWANQRVRKVTAATGLISTVAGGGTSSADGIAATSALIQIPSGLALDAAGDLFIADGSSSRVRRVDASSGIITTVAGNGTFGPFGAPNGDGGPATAAALSVPYGVAVTAAGDLYIVDGYTSSVRLVRAATGIISTIAGTGNQGFSGDGGAATAAVLHSPEGITVAGSGDIYVADFGNGRVRRIATSGIITTVAGDAGSSFNGDGIAATSANLSGPNGLALDATGNLYIADPGNARIRMVASGTGLISTVAGNGARGYSGDGALATSTQFSNLDGIAYGPSGDLYVVQKGDNRICRISAATGIVSTVVGIGSYGFSGDGGPATAAELANPVRIVFDSAGNLLITDQDNHRIRKVSATTGIITTIAGSGGSSAPIPSAGGFSGDGGPATAATLNYPVGLCIAANGDILVADGRNNRVRRIAAATGIITTICGRSQSAFAGDGGPATSAALAYPTDVQVDQAGNILIADLYNNRVRRISAADGTISTYAGNGTATVTAAVGDGGPATAAMLYTPGALFIDAHGDLVISVYGNNDALRRVDHTTGIITTFAGSSVRGFSGDGGPATLARLNGPTVACRDPAGNLVFSDNFNARVRKVISTPLLAAENPPGVLPGLTYSYYEGGWGSLPDFTVLAPIATGTAAQMDLSPRRRDTLYALRFTGYVSVPVDGTYTFYSTSDDGSNLSIGGTLVVDNDGRHPAQERSGTIALAAGLHSVTARYYQNGGGAAFSVSYSGPGLAKQAIPASALSHQGTDAAPAEVIDPNIADPLVELGGLTYFGGTTAASGRELWATDGTPAGTRLVADLAPGSAGSDPRHLTLFGGKIYFTANDGAHGRELWTSDGTAAGTHLVVDLAAGESSANPAHLFVVGTRLVFSAYQPGTGWRLWSSDGTAAGTVLLKDIDPSPTADEFSYNWLHVFCVVGSKLFFNGSDPQHGSALWVTDGTASGTRLVRNTTSGAPGMEPIAMTAFAGKLYYTSRTDNSTMWVSDGTDAGTHQFSALTHFNDFNTAVGGLLYFRGTTDSFNNGIWVTDGNAAHQTLLSTTLSATAFYFGFGSAVFMNPDAPAQFPYRPLAISTGTPASTGVLVPVSFDLPFAVGSRFFFTSGASLWRCDGTATGTALVTNRIASPATVGQRGALALIAPRYDWQRYDVLWASDGTDAGTVLLLSDTTIAVTSPDVTAGITTTSTGVTVAGTASATLGGIDHVAFTMSGATSGAGTATGTTAWSIAPTVNTGVTLLTITATGASGATASTTVTVTCIASPLVLAITAPTASASWTSTVASVPIGGSASGSATITAVDYVLSGATSGGGSASGTTSWSFTPVLAPGDTLVTVTAHDAAGMSATRALTVTYSNLVPAEHPGATQPGLAYAYAEGTWSLLPDFAGLIPVATGTATQLDLSLRHRDTLYALRFTGYLAVPTDGIYTFSTTSDDGSNLTIGGTLVVDNDGAHPSQLRTGTIGLQAGLHAFAAEYFQGGGGAVFNVTWSGPGVSAQAIPAAALSHVQPPGGGILREFWTGVPGRTVASLTSWPAFPLAPSGTSLQPSFLAPSNWADNYGTRMRGYVTAPVTGSYSFWIAGDDQCELWLSPTTGLPQDKVLIATVPSATAPLAWGTFPQQHSAAFALTAGQSYYIEALHKEAGGGDCLAVGWQLPDATFERPIPGLRLTPALSGTAQLQREAAPGSAER